MFSKLQSVKAIANSMNNRVIEFKKYFKGIIVSDFHENIQESISEVIHKNLIELEKKWRCSFTSM